MNLGFPAAMAIWVEERSWQLDVKDVVVLERYGQSVFPVYGEDGKVKGVVAIYVGRPDSDPYDRQQWSEQILPVEDGLTPEQIKERLLLAIKRGAEEISSRRGL